MSGCLCSKAQVVLGRARKDVARPMRCQSRGDEVRPSHDLVVVSVLLLSPGREEEPVEQRADGLDRVEVDQEAALLDRNQRPGGAHCKCRAKLEPPGRHAPRDGGVP